MKTPLGLEIIEQSQLTKHHSHRLNMEKRLASLALRRGLRQNSTRKCSVSYIFIQFVSLVGFFMSCIIFMANSCSCNDV